MHTPFIWALGHDEKNQHIHDSAPLVHQVPTEVNCQALRIHPMGELSRCCWHRAASSLGRHSSRRRKLPFHMRASTQQATWKTGIRRSVGNIGRAQTASKDGLLDDKETHEVISLMEKCVSQISSRQTRNQGPQTHLAKHIDRRTG